MARIEPLVVTGTPSQVRHRIEERLCVVTDVWFPTRAEMRSWEASASPLYVKWTRRGGVEIGPRLETMPAARLVPALRGELVSRDTGVVLDLRLRWPRVTAWILLGFTLALVGWGVDLAIDLQAGRTHLGWVGAWVATLVAVHGGAAIAWFQGRAMLMAELPWLRQALSRTLVDGEDWG